MDRKLALLAGIASDWIWEMDADLRFTFVSDRFAEVFGMPASSVVGKRRTDLSRSGYDDPAWQKHLDDVASRRPFRDFETNFIDAQGVFRPVAISGSPLYAADGTFEGYVGVGHDLTRLRQRETAALEKSRHLEAILQNVGQGVGLIDENLNVVTYNGRLAEWLEADDAPDARGQPYEQALRYLARRGEYVNEDVGDPVGRRLAVARAGMHASTEYTRPNGRIVLETFNPMPGGGGVITYSDITQARKREARLARSEENFRYRFRNLPLPQWVYHRETLRFLEVNDPALAKLGYSHDEFLAMTIRDIRPPEEVPKLMRWLEHDRIRDFHTTEWRLRTKDGRPLDTEIYVRDIDYEGEPARIALVIDVTARNEAQRQMQRLFETSRDLIHVTDSRGNFLQVSPSSAEVLGYALGDMLGRNASEFILADDIDQTREAMRAMRRGNPPGEFRCRYLDRNGGIVPFVWSGVWSERDRRYFFIGRDMTEPDRTEQQLRQAQKMEAVGQLTGGVAHDFNNILMVILANVEALEEDQRFHPALRRQVDAISGATQRAAELTSQLLAFSRKQTLQPQKTDINALVTTTATLLRRTVEEQIEITSVLAADLWPVEVDRGQLQSALVNLSINARDAMPDGGRLLVKTANVTLDAAYAARNPDAVAGEYVSIAVSDTGQGIAPGNLARVFEPFFTTKGPGKGTGLGLSMVYGFIRQSGGHIKIDSELGRGTTIRLHLPRLRNDDGAAEATPTTEMPRGCERVLLVEDDTQVRASVVGQLRGLGYTVTEASDGPSALVACEASPAAFDLLLTDVIMPGPLNGKALGDEVARRWPRTRLVFMSGYTEDAIVHRGRLDPGVLLLNKPFRRAELARMLRRALDGPPTSESFRSG